MEAPESVTKLQQVGRLQVAAGGCRGQGRCASARIITAHRRCDVPFASTPCRLWRGPWKSCRRSISSPCRRRCSFVARGVWGYLRNRAAAPAAGLLQQAAAAVGGSCSPQQPPAATYSRPLQRADAMNNLVALPRLCGFRLFRTHKPLAPLLPAGAAMAPPTCGGCKSAPTGAQLGCERCAYASQWPSHTCSQQRPTRALRLLLRCVARLVSSLCVTPSHSGPCSCCLPPSSPLRCAARIQTAEQAIYQRLGNFQVRGLQLPAELHGVAERNALAGCWLAA